eukprot:14094303-Ditylum_brightwellii.AAC.1
MGMFVSATTDPETGKQLDYCDLVSDARYNMVWEKAFTKELDQLAQGRKSTYGCIVCDYQAAEGGSELFVTNCRQ